MHVIITPLDYDCNLVTLQCRKGRNLSSLCSQSFLYWWCITAFTLQWFCISKVKTSRRNSLKPVCCPVISGYVLFVYLPQDKRYLPHCTTHTVFKLRAKCQQSRAGPFNNYLGILEEIWGGGPCGFGLCCPSQHCRTWYLETDHGSMEVQQCWCSDLQGCLLSSCQRGTSGVFFAHTLVHVIKSPTGSPQNLYGAARIWEPVVLSCSASSVTVGAVELDASVWDSVMQFLRFILLICLVTGNLWLVLNCLTIIFFFFL